MKIEILHSRDPDYECDVHLFIDGVEVTEFYETDIDPGRGYWRKDWDERIEGVREANLSPAYKALVLEELEAASDSPYIRDEEW